MSFFTKSPLLVCCITFIIVEYACKHMHTDCRLCRIGGARAIALLLLSLIHFWVELFIAPLKLWYDCYTVVILANSSTTALLKDSKKSYFMLLS